MRTEVKKSAIHKAEATLNGKVELSEPSLREAPAVGRRHHTAWSERSELTRNMVWRSPHYPSDRAGLTAERRRCISNVEGLLEGCRCFQASGGAASRYESEEWSNDFVAMAFMLQATIADINIDKSWSGYYWLGNGFELS